MKPQGYTLAELEAADSTHKERGVTPLLPGLWEIERHKADTKRWMDRLLNHVPWPPPLSQWHSVKTTRGD